MKLLHLDSSILGGNSASRSISAAIVEGLRASTPGLEVTYRDLVANPVPHLTLDTFPALESGAELRDFLAADVVVIGAGFYNFTIPSQLKTWIDHILVKGQTFAYTQSGPVGLAKGKRVIIALARGGIYQEGSPAAGFEHAETLLRSVFAFIGSDVEFVIAEGLALGDEPRRTAMDGAMAQARQIAA